MYLKLLYYKTNAIKILSYWAVETEVNKHMSITDYKLKKIFFKWILEIFKMLGRKRRLKDIKTWMQEDKKDSAAGVGIKERGWKDALWNAMLSMHENTHFDS